jgi:hypothetical protein
MTSSSQNEDNKFTLEYSKNRRHSGSHQEYTRDDLIMKDYYGDLNRLLHNLVGPAFMAGGAGGLVYGFGQSIQYWNLHSNRPKKLLFSAGLNIVGKNCSKFANICAALALLYCFDKRIINFMFKEEIEELSEPQRAVVYGFTTGFVFKVFSKGIYSGLLAGSLLGGVAAVPYFYDTYVKK